MSNSFTQTDTTTFTITHARHLASKVSTDLKRIQRFYGSPLDGRINDYEAELIELLKGGYLAKVVYGFQRKLVWIEPTLTYVASELAGFGDADNDPGRIPPGADVSGARFSSYLIHNDAWMRLSPAQRAAVEARLPFARVGASEPSASGRFAPDLTYSAGGRALGRTSLRSV